LLDISFVYLAVVASVYLVLAKRSPEKTRESLRVSRRTLAKLLPLLVAIFALVGLFQVFVPPSWIEARLGASAGGSTLLFGGALGAVAMGPPLAAFPLAGSLLDAGAWPPAVAAFIVSWISVGLVSLPFEAQIFGVRFALVRNTLAFGSALLVGWLIGILL